MTHKVEPIYRPVKDNDIIDDVIIAIDDLGNKFLIEAPEWIHPSFFEGGPLIHKIPIFGFTCTIPGVYKCELMCQIVKSEVHGEYRRWADELEWYCVGYRAHTKEVLLGEA